MTRVLEMNGSSARSHTVFVTSRGLSSHAREMVVRSFRQVFEAKVTEIHPEFWAKGDAAMSADH